MCGGGVPCPVHLLDTIDPISGQRNRRQRFIRWHIDVPRSRLISSGIGIFIRQYCRIFGEKKTVNEHTGKCRRPGLVTHDRGSTKVEQIKIEIDLHFFFQHNVGNVKQQLTRA